MDRRIPWVTYVLALLCVLGFFYAKLEAVGVEAVVDTQLDAAAQTLRDHPYLLLPPLLEKRIPPDHAARLRRDHERARVERSAPPVPPRIVARQQAELDRMVAAAEQRIDSLPPRRFGVRATERNPLSFLTHLFFHGGALHLVANLVLLVLVGRVLESAWGGAVHACVISAGVLGGTAAFFAQHPFNAEPLVGTSGLVAGLVGAFAVRFASRRGRVVYVPSLLLAILVLGLPVWLGFEWSIARGAAAEPARLGAWNPSMAMLVGGFASGALAAFGVRLLGLEGRIGRAEVKAALRAPTNDPERALEEHNSGDSEAAYHRLAERLRCDAGNRDVALAFWDVCNDLGRAPEAAPVLLGVIREELRRGTCADAVGHWLDLVARELDAGAEPALLLRMGPLLRDAGESVAARRALENALARAPGDPGVASRVAREALELDPELASDAASCALGSVELSLQERRALEALVASLASAPKAARLGHTYRPAGVVLPRPAQPPVIGPDGIDFEEEPRELDCVEAVAIQLDSEGLQVAIDGARKRVRYECVKAVAVAAVSGLHSKIVIVIDLVLNWGSLGDAPLQVVRLRTDRFDPRSLAAGTAEPLDAVRAIVKQLLRRCDATPLPDAESARGAPFASFKSLGDYNRDVLAVHEPDDA